jgi:hypothetical protein
MTEWIIAHYSSSLTSYLCTHYEEQSNAMKKVIREYNYHKIVLQSKTGIEILQCAKTQFFKTFSFWLTITGINVCCAS